MRPSFRVFATAAAAVVLVAAVLVIQISGKERLSGPAAEAVPDKLPAAGPVNVARLPEPEKLEIVPGAFGPPDAAPPAAPEETTAALTAAPAMEEPEPVNYYNGMDPNDQPRDILHIPLAGSRTLPAGYEATDDFLLSDGGWTLDPPEPGEEDEPRIAMIESPPIPLNFASNAVNPLWKEVSPEGTEVLVEVSLSEDGENWTDWMPTTSGHYEGEMSPTYPDGRPNPNYGYTLGDMTFYGLKRFQYFRYAVTLYSETREAPVVSDFRLFYQDSTMGDSELAQAGTAESGGSVQ